MPLTPSRLAWLLANAVTGSVLACGTCAAAADTSATAPTDTVSSGAAPAATPTGELSEVIVTAEKRSESLLSVPAPVTTLSTGDLARQGDVQLSDYAATVPGLNLISSEPGQSVVIMRGISTGFGASIPATTATYIDDVPYGSSTANAYGSIATLDLDPATLQRVEVLRGPQGTLYGASSMGGLIKYVTVSPSLTNYSARVEVDGSSVDNGGEGGGVRTMLDGPLVRDTLGLTLSAFYRTDPGYIDDPHRNLENVNGSHADGGRVALFWLPTERFSVKLSVLTQDTETPSTSDVDVNSNLTPIYGKYEQVRYGNENWDFRNWLYSLTANYDLGWASLTSITGYSTRDAVWDIDESTKLGGLASGALGIPNLGLFDDVTLANEKTTQEFRIASPDNDRLEWMAGLYFTHEHSVKPEINQQPFSLTTGIPVPQSLDPDGIYNDILHDSYTEYAGYADLTFHMTSKLKVLGGIRYSDDTENSLTPFSGLLNGPPIVAIGDSSSKPVTYLFSPSYNLNDRNMLYVRIATGFRPGGPTGVTSNNLTAGAPETYRPDKLTNYELGYKASFPDQRMSIDASAYDIEWKDVQVLTEINGFFVTGNGAAARSDGAEIAWAWRPLSGVSLSANAAYTDAHMTENAPAISAKAGDELPDVPKLSANLAADYDFPISADVSGFVGGNFQHLGARAIDFVSGVPANYERPDMPAYNTVNLRAGLTCGGLTVEGYVKNVANTYGITRLVSEVRDGYDAPFAAAIIPPRTVGLSVVYNF